MADERDRQESALRELYEQLLRTNARLAALVDASRSVAAEQDRGAALQLAAEALRGLCGVEQASLYLLDGEGALQISASTAPDGAVPQRVAVSTEEGTEILGASGDTPLAVGAGLREGRPELVELLAGGAPGVLGVLCLQKGGGAAAFSDEERMLASALSGHLAISCWNSMLLEEIRHQAAFDDLTGLAGRRHFMDELHRELDRARREERPLSVLMLDADHFKQLNDRHGHAAGDSVLAALAERLRRGTRSIDVVGRLGGEEMGVLLPGAGPTVAVMVAERIRRSVAAMHVPWVGDEALRLTVSVGAATWDRVLGAEQLLALADRALYAAKERGRDQVVSLEQLETMETLDLPIVR